MERARRIADALVLTAFLAFCLLAGWLALVLGAVWGLVAFLVGSLFYAMHSRPLLAELVIVSLVTGIVVLMAPPYVALVLAVAWLAFVLWDLGRIVRAYRRLPAGPTADPDRGMTRARMEAALRAETLRAIRARLEARFSGDVQGAASPSDGHHPNEK